MGYEIKLLIGKESSFTHNELKTGPPELDNGEIYRPIIEDEEGNPIPTGRKETYYFVYAMIDLCKPGYSSEIYKLSQNARNDSNKHFWYWYDGDEKKTEDRYGVKPMPIDIKKVVSALRVDSKNDDYRRFEWALALLSEMEKDQEELTVIFYGY